MKTPEVIARAVKDARDWATADARGRCAQVKRLCQGRHNKTRVLALGLRLLADYHEAQAYIFLGMVQEEEERRRGWPAVFKGAKGEKRGDK